MRQTQPLGAAADAGAHADADGDAADAAAGVDFGDCLTAAKKYVKS
jgi:hypothetical protein